MHRLSSIQTLFDTAYSNACTLHLRELHAPSDFRLHSAENVCPLIEQGWGSLMGGPVWALLTT